VHEPEWRKGELRRQAAKAKLTAKMQQNVLVSHFNPFVCDCLDQRTEDVERHQRPDRHALVVSAALLAKKLQFPMTERADRLRQRKLRC
jgi:hypothetical protein